MSGVASFRSVLPHEPRPTERHGYLQLQGALAPKKLKPFTGDTSDEEKSEFWTVETLERALTLILSKRTLPENSLSIPIPYAVQHVQVLDAQPPFTKVRLTYESPLAAISVLMAWKAANISSAALFANEPSTPSDNNISVSSVHRNHHATFTSRPFQLTSVTTTPLPMSSWDRTSPPKFRRFIPRPGEDVNELELQRNATRFVFLSNLIENEGTKSTAQPSTPLSTSTIGWNDAHLMVEAIRSVLNQYDTSGNGIEVFVSAKKLTQYCYVGMRSALDAQAVVQALQDQIVTWQHVDSLGSAETVTSTSVNSGKLFVDYAGVTDRSLTRAQAYREGAEVGRGEPARSECTSITDHVTVPGLVILPDFVTEIEQDVLLATLTGPHAPWAPLQVTPTGGIVKRRVQHYGYVFDYQTADVLRNRTSRSGQCPALPAVSDRVQPGSSASLEEYVASSIRDGRGWDVLAGVIERTRQTQFETGERQCRFPTLNQLTVNQYLPGEGIGSHVDTKSAFSDGLISVSLNAGVVMEFRKVVDENTEPVKKYVYLPPRSLVLMAGPARYEWEHMIVNRMTDTHNGVVIPRSLRVSLTVRSALDLQGKPMPLVETRRFPPTWCCDRKNEDQLDILVTPACERDHVHAVYNAVATQWHHTRGRRGVLWPGATQFLQQLPPGSVVADVGCGDGKYFPAIWEAGSYVIGTDISFPLLRTALKAADEEDEVPETRRVGKLRKHLSRRPAIMVADCMSVPFRDNSCDAAICIAVMHHLSTRERRVRCIAELVRIVKPGGLINIQAWAMEQEQGSRRKFATNDVFVPFNAQPKYLQLSEAEKNTNPVSKAGPTATSTSMKSTSSASTAQVYSEAFNADFDELKGLVVFKRYCHMYREGEMEQLVSEVPNAQLSGSGVESGNHFVIIKVLD
jgi:alkylated DNA repair dioxygenase AlkB/SAM-dependent methyltransferase